MRWGERPKKGVLTRELSGVLNSEGRGPPIKTHSGRLQNTLADGILRWPRPVLADKFRELTSSIEWIEQDIGPRGSGIFHIGLQTKNIFCNHDNFLWDLVTNDIEPG